MKNLNDPNPESQDNDLESENDQLALRYYEDKYQKLQEEYGLLREKYLPLKYKKINHDFEEWVEPEDLREALRKCAEALNDLNNWKKILKPLPELYCRFNKLNDFPGMVKSVQEAALKRIDFKLNTTTLVHFKSAVVLIKTDKFGDFVQVKALSNNEKCKLKETYNPEPLIEYFEFTRDIANWTDPENFIYIPRAH